jgi:hypothetical protein
MIAVYYIIEVNNLDRIVVYPKENQHTIFLPRVGEHIRVDNLINNILLDDSIGKIFALKDDAVNNDFDLNEYMFEDTYKVISITHEMSFVTPQIILLIR